MANMSNMAKVYDDLKIERHEKEKFDRAKDIMVIQKKRMTNTEFLDVLLGLWEKEFLKSGRTIKI